MEVLHVLRSEPDETTEKFIESISGSQAKRFPLFKGDVDWDAFIDAVLEHEKIICWW